MYTKSLEDIFEMYQERLRDATWLLVALKEAGQPLLKEKLKEEANRVYAEKNNRNSDDPPLIGSRHTLDLYTSMLYGACLVDVTEVGKARMYSLTTVAHDFILWNKNRKKARGSLNG